MNGLSRFGNYKTAFTVIALLGVGLRLLLWWVNPAGNAFDNHFEPIYWIMEKGSIPPKYALWESYQPPVFYVVSALIGKAALGIGLPHSSLPKMLQFIPCLYGMLTLGVIYLILKGLPLSDMARLFAFAAVCFLPRHIYTCVMHSNDTLSNLLVALTAYMMLEAYRRGFGYRYAAMSGLCSVLAVFTKYTSLVVFPMALGIIAPMLLRKTTVPAKRRVSAVLLMLVLPLMFFSAYLYANSVDYNTPLPLNDDSILARGGANPQTVTKANFTDFRLCEAIRMPILYPGKMDSFWTLVYSGMWFDVEPKFLFLIDGNIDFWGDYYDWLRGERCYPPAIAMTRAESLTGSALIAMGLVPLMLVSIGFFRMFRAGNMFRCEAPGGASAGMQIFPLLLVFNTTGVVFLTMRVPVYSSMKALYFMNSLPAFSVSLGLGFMLFEKHGAMRMVLTALLILLSGLVTLHILHIARFSLMRSG